MAYDQISVLEDLEKDYQNNKSTNPKNVDYQINLEQSKKRRERTIKNLLDYSSMLTDFLNLFSKDLEQGVIAITKHLIWEIQKLKIPTDERSREGIFINDVIETNRYYNEILTNIKPNPIQDFEKSLDGFSDFTDERGILKTKNFMNHLYSRKLNKK